MAREGDERRFESVGLFEFAEERAAFADHAVLAERIANDRRQLVGIPRLADVAVDVPFIDRIDDRVDVGVTGHHEPDNVREFFAHPGEKLRASHARHALVGDDDVNVGTESEDVERLIGALGGQDLIFAAKEAAETGEDFGFVVDDQERRLGGMAVRSRPARRIGAGRELQ
jgi:hypothetical protein